MCVCVCACVCVCLCVCVPVCVCVCVCVCVLTFLSDEKAQRERLPLVLYPGVGLFTVKHSPSLVQSVCERRGPAGEGI